LGRQANGTQASLTATAADNTLLFVNAAGHNGTIGYNTFSVAMQFRAAENYTTSSAGSYITFSTTPTGSIAIAEAMRIAPNGNIGIGTASPGQKLTLINGTFQIGGTSTFSDNIEIGRVGSDNNMAFATGGTERLRITTGGNVGIGTTAPQSNLQVLGTIKVATGNAQGILGLGEANGTTVNVGLWRGAANAPTTDGNFLNLGGYEGIVFAVGAAAIGSQTERLRITSGGNVLIGTATAPSAIGVNDLLVIGKSGSASNAINFSNGSTTNWGYLLAESGKMVLGSGTSSNITFETNAGSERMRITSGGNVGIGTTSID
jgi:hypothetical protein